MYGSQQAATPQILVCATNHGLARGDAGLPSWWPRKPIRMQMQAATLRLRQAPLRPGLSNTTRNTDHHDRFGAADKEDPLPKQPWPWHGRTSLSGNGREGCIRPASSVLACVLAACFRCSDVQSASAGGSIGLTVAREVDDYSREI